MSLGLVPFQEGELIDGKGDSEVDEVGKCWQEDNEEIIDKLLKEIIWVKVLLN